MLGEPARSLWRRLALAIAGSAEVGVGELEHALERLLAAKQEMDNHQVIHDWYCRMMVQSALTDLWLARGDLSRARQEAEAFLAVTSATAERTWQALAWEANARLALRSTELARAEECLTKALAAMNGYEVPLAEWQVHATAAELSEELGEIEAAQHHARLSRSTVLRLADSLPASHPLRKTFLSAPRIRKITSPERLSQT
jgi:tetratricopeptide (TPR) repeat protein